MSQSIGQIIKRLRKERNLTQEELAEQLNVTSQAVSKWESETGMPDISQIVPLATVFGVSTDVLFGRFGIDNNEEIEIIIDKIMAPTKEKHADDNEVLDLELTMYEQYSEALKQYPNNSKLLLSALGNTCCMLTNYSCLSAYTENEELKARIEKKIEKKRMLELYDESIRWANLIINYSTVIDDVYQAEYWLIYIYKQLKKYDEALKVIDKFPSTIGCKGLQLAAFYGCQGKFDEEIAQRCKNISELLEVLDEQIINLGIQYKKHGQTDKALFTFEAILKLIPVFYGNEKYTPPFHTEEWIYKWCAECYQQIGKTDEVIKMLEDGLNYIIEQGKGYNVITKLETPLLHECEFKYWGNNYGVKSKAIDLLDSKAFDSICGDTRFQLLLNKANALSD